MEENNENKTETTTTTTTTNTTAEKKQNWFKAHMAVCIVSVIVVIAAVVAIVLLVNNKGPQSPEKVMETYVEAMKEGNVDKLMNIMDIKGACAWAKCGRNPEKLEEAYNSISDEDAKKYETTARTGLETAMKLLSAFGNVEMSINKMETPKELGKNLYSVKANVNIKVSVFGVEQEQTQDMSVVVYNGKYIGEAK